MYFNTTLVMALRDSDDGRESVILGAVSQSVNKEVSVRGRPRIDRGEREDAPQFIH